MSARVRGVLTATGIPAPVVAFFTLRAVLGEASDIARAEPNQPADLHGI
jgi:hypothetical protein